MQSAGRRVIVAGSKSFDDYGFMKRKLDEYFSVFRKTAFSRLMYARSAKRMTANPPDYINPISNHPKK